ncbi:Fes1-domain-containing protein [Acaromyces ingoldii]|uniref:Fes1-domain-containing protein n=1 Tax=Acaromyces ingoldii TaxID=215250 RepID=A0A316YN21_9BASI|nr:Fes1-domain-containing protein [Acaromyces ingoldii]PWN90767.1 Fes1-domain-containing protein [Acaromyces ingoldii]
MAQQQPRNLDDLLKWSIAQQGADPDARAANGQTMHDVAADLQAGRRPDLADPGLYDALMGKNEAQMMKEELSAAMDTSRSEDDRVTALDNFEMLIEQIDNANNVNNMKMWEPILSLLTASSSTPRIQHAVLWIVGTAVQNNDKAQMAILAYKPLTPILYLLRSSQDGEVRSKAMYALSGILKHSPSAVALFDKDEQGWMALKGALLDPNVALRRKAAFLINSLLLQDDSVPTTTATTGSTAVAPMPDSINSASSTRSDPHGQPPLERGPETLLSGVAHPPIPPALLSSGLLQALIASLLLSHVHTSLSSLRDVDVPLAGGPDGDQDPRSDLDYSEKASRACLTFVDRAREQHLKLPDPKPAAELFEALQKDLEGPAIEKDASAGIETRWQELGLDRNEVEAFERGWKELLQQ